MGGSQGQGGSVGDGEEAGGAGLTDLPDWVTYHGVTTQTTFDLVRVAEAFGDGIPVDAQRALTRELARRDGESTALRAGIQSWLRKVAASPHQPVRLECAAALDLSSAGTPLKEIAGQVGLILAGDTDTYVALHVTRFIMFAGNDESRENWRELRDYVSPGEVVGIVSRMCQREAETPFERATLIAIVGGAARTVQSFGVLDHLLMQLVAPIIDGRVDDRESLDALAWLLCSFAEYLEPETFAATVPFVADHPDREVRDHWRESAEYYPKQWEAVQKRLTEISWRPQVSGDVPSPDRRDDPRLEDVEPGDDLRGYDLRGAHLAGRKLNDCDFTGVDLTGADLRGASLIGAVLYRAVLIGAQLDRVDLSNAILSGADLSTATLFAANLVAASCIGTDLRGANLTAARFRGANLEDADLRGALMDGTDVYCARIIGAKFDGLGPEGCL